MTLTCSSCGRENREGSKFCDGCGARLAVICPGCGSIDPGERFCRYCGASLATGVSRTGSPGPDAPPPAAREPEGERKQLTVLFADVQGSMELQEELDVEAWAQIVDRFVKILADAVRRFGGTVDKFTGDGIMALFGAPVALEDHARRACHAAWQMAADIKAYAGDLRRSDGVDLNVRIGLNSGEAVVGHVGQDLRIDPTALGHTVGLAQRMEALALPGAVYLTQHTARLVDGWFRIRDLGPVTVKGAREPLGVFVLEGLAPPRAKGGRATRRLVGRASEMARLEEALARASEGHAQVVGVVGEPGVGKSRLCEEFVRSVVARGLSVGRAAGVSHGREVPLLPVLAYFREYFGIIETDSAGQARERIGDRLLGLDPSFADDLPLFFDFLEVPDPQRPVRHMAPEVRMQRIFEVLRRVTARRSEREIRVLIFEDLHWFDPQSGAFLERLLENFPGSRTLVVTNFRPEFSAPWMRHSYYQQVSLVPLSVEAVGELVNDQLGDDPTLAPLATYLEERTGGNPFFVEEVVRALIEDGTLSGQDGAYRLSRPLDQARLPASVQSVLAARIDRLSADHKPVLQSAAVIGRTFAEAVLARVTGQAVEALAEALSALCAAELLQEAQRYPAAEYRFWHVLTQEVAYGTLLAGRRARLHAAVADALIELDGDRLDEEAAVVAWHWERAGRRLEAARWNYRAALHMLRTNLGESLRRLRSAVALLDGVEETRESLKLGAEIRLRLMLIGARAGETADDVERLEAESRLLADRLGDPFLKAQVAGFSGSVRYYAGDLQGGMVRYLECIQLGQATGDPEYMALTVVPSVLAFISVGSLDEGVRLADDAIRRCTGNPNWGLSAPGYRTHPRLLQLRAATLARMGRLRDATADVCQALALVEGRGEPETRCWSLALLPHLAWLTGEGADTHASCLEGVQVAEETGNMVSLVFGLEALAIAHLLGGRPEDAKASCERALTVAREKRSGLFTEASVLAHLAQARLAAGEVPAAMTAAEEAVDVARRQGARVHECLALLTRARVRRSSSTDAEGVTADLEAALVLVGDVGALIYEPFIREELGRLSGEDAELWEAVRLYHAIGASGHARRLEVELAGSSSLATTTPGEG